MTMREFGEKYKGNVQAALRGFQKEKFVGGGGEGGLGETDKSTRKRKWVASQDIDEEASGSGSVAATAAAESSRTVKNGRIFLCIRTSLTMLITSHPSTVDGRLTEKETRLVYWSWDRPTRPSSRSRQQNTRDSMHPFLTPKSTK